MEANAPAVEDLYRAVVGEKKAGYYVPKFLDFDSPDSTKISWNWPAFFATFLWMMYRRMYGHAFAYIFGMPFALGILGAVLVAVLGPKAGVIAYLVLAVGVPFVVAPMYANAVYYRYVKERIASATRRTKSADAAIERLASEPATTHGAVVALIAGGSVIPVIGILAAIAIPAYQDYTIRTQVTEGLNLAGPIKVAVVESFHRDGSWPQGTREMQIPEEDLNGIYVDQIEVEDGTLYITYGGQAHERISGGVLTLRPSLRGETVAWSCGYGVDEGEDPASGAAGEHATSLSPKYLPSLCRGTGK